CCRHYCFHFAFLMSFSNDQFFVAARLSALGCLDRFGGNVPVTLACNWIHRLASPRILSDSTLSSIATMFDGAVVAMPGGALALTSDNVIFFQTSVDEAIRAFTSLSGNPQ